MNSRSGGDAGWIKPGQPPAVTPFFQTFANLTLRAPATSRLGCQQSSVPSPLFVHSGPSSLSGCPLFLAPFFLPQMVGVDLTTIDGIGEHSALQIVSEIGTNVDAVPTERHFVSWLSLCPELNKSGGRKQKKGRSPTHRNSNRVAQVGLSSMRRSVA